MEMRMSLDEVVVFNDERRDEVLMVDEALRKFYRVDPRAAEVVELRYFGGLQVDEVAKVLRLTDRTVKRDWRLAQAWLKRYFEQSPTDRPAC
jgi:DNA-directed RNA polymerase specialized sigma24 family protein